MDSIFSFWRPRISSCEHQHLFTFWPRGEKNIIAKKSSTVLRADFPNKLKQWRNIGVELEKCDNFLSDSQNHFQCKSARISRHLSKPFSLSIETLASKWILKKFSRRFRFLMGKVGWMLMFTGCWCSLDLSKTIFGPFCMHCVRWNSTDRTRRVCLINVRVQINR